MRLLPLLGLLHSVAALAQEPVPCSFPVTRLSPDFALRSLGGVYDLEWFSSSHTVRRERLWLWPSLPTDSSVALPGIRPTPNDSLRYPLWGTTTDRAMALSAEDSLRRHTDPLDPPVVLMAPFTRGDLPTLLVGTVATRRLNVLTFDGAGIGVWLSHADAAGLAGSYGPYGIIAEDSGFACARRVK